MPGKTIAKYAKWYACFIDALIHGISKNILLTLGGGANSTPSPKLIEPFKANCLYMDGNHVRTVLTRESHLTQLLNVIYETVWSGT